MQLLVLFNFYYNINKLYSYKGFRILNKVDGRGSQISRVPALIPLPKSGLSYKKSI